MEIEAIAHIRTDFPTKFGIPRQSGLVNELEAEIVFEEKYRVNEALRGIEGYSHLWLIWGFSEVKQRDWSPTVRPPRLGGNVRMGVFATRSPFRPNPLGLSSVKLCEVKKTAEGAVLTVCGADLMDGTPIYDIKPYLPFTDSHPDALGGFSAPSDAVITHIDFPEEFLEQIPEHCRKALLGVLEQDPRPAYQSDPDRIYGFEFAGFEIRFTVCGDVLTVRDVEKVATQ